MLLVLCCVSSVIASTSEATSLEEVFPELGVNVKSHVIRAYEYQQDMFPDLDRMKKKFDFEQWINSLKRFSAESKQNMSIVYVETLPNGIVFIRVRGVPRKVVTEDVWRIGSDDITKLCYRPSDNQYAPEKHQVEKMEIWRFDSDSFKVGKETYEAVFDGRGLNSLLKLSSKIVFVKGNEIQRTVN